MGGSFVGSDKLLRFPERIAEWMRTGKTSGPIVVDFDLTNRCPHKCPGCPGEWRSDPEAEMSFEDARRWLLEFAAIGTKAVVFGGGGDPLAHPRPIEIMGVARRAGMSVGVITNGACLDKKKALELVNLAEWVRVSLDAATPETFARVHGVPKAHFQTILDNIRLLCEARGQARVGVGFLTSQETASEMVPATRLAKELGTKFIHFRPYNGDTYEATDEIVDARVATQPCFAVVGSPKYGDMGHSRPYARCFVHNFSTVVTAKGDLQVCCDQRTDAGRWGNLRDAPLAYQWQSYHRERTMGHIDLKKCNPLCKGDANNKLLWNLTQPIADQEFL